MQENKVKSINKNDMKQILNRILPLYIQVELKTNKKAVKIANNLSYEQISRHINKKFPSASQNLVTQEKLDKIYEGIVDIINQDTETGMIFKNVIDVEIVKMYFYPCDLSEAHLLQSKDETNIILLVFKKE